MALPGVGDRGPDVQLARACTRGGAHDAFRVRTLPRWAVRNSGLTDNERSDEFVRALSGLVCVGQIDAARAVAAPGPLVADCARGAVESGVAGA